MSVPTDELAGFNVLIADDDGGPRELLAEVCRERGLAVTTAADGRAAVTALERSSGEFQLVFADITMPGADGFAVLAAARAANPRAYVVIATGYASLDTAIRAIRDGANDYLAKPFALGQIDVTLLHARKHLALARRQDVDARLEALERRLASIDESIARVDVRLESLLRRI